jgi:hypothetical protein
MLLYYAASKAGVVPVPLNYRLAPLFVIKIRPPTLFVDSHAWIQVATPPPARHSAAAFHDILECRRCNCNALTPKGILGTPIRRQRCW